MDKLTETANRLGQTISRSIDTVPDYARTQSDRRSLATLRQAQSEAAIVEERADLPDWLRSQILKSSLAKVKQAKGIQSSMSDQRYEQSDDSKVHAARPW